MSKTNKKQQKTKKSLMKQATNGVLTILVLIFLLGAFVNFGGKLADDRVVDAIEAGGAINPPSEDDWVTSRQVEFTDAIMADIIEAKTKLAAIEKMRSSSSGEKEKKRRAEEALYSARLAYWESLTTPLYFEHFAGLVEKIATSRVAGGPNSGSTKVDMEIKLFGSGIVLEDEMILDQQNNPANTPNASIWEITSISGSELNWFDITEGSSVTVTGVFTRYSQDAKWAHCCISSTGFPVFRVDISSVAILAE